jgi:hypothetical protein
MAMVARRLPTLRFTMNVVPDCRMLYVTEPAAPTQLTRRFDL